MSKIYEALQRAQEEREGAAPSRGEGEFQPRRPWWRRGPKANGARSSGTLHIDFDLAPDIEEAYQRLGTHVLLPSREQPVLRDLMVVASQHGEGATTTAALFASTLAKRKKLDVLLIEANFRTPALEQVFPIRRNGGFAELVEGRQGIETVVQPTPHPGLFVITSGHYESSPSAILESSRFAEVMETLHERFQFVVFDSAPANVYTDALILGPHTDGAVFVVEADRTRIDEAQRAKRQLERAGTKMLGALFNRRKSYLPAFLEEMV
ncbi:MAG: CpsD/CapB family tyrosine-protein kinase [Deltaproteobacteria bacterium]|nr:CpsD/CapB family tyrosine-protein kinase [Deltaproteobacteria bacterium]